MLKSMRNNNLILLHFFTLIEFFAFSIFFYLEDQAKAYKSYLFFSLWVFFAGFSVVDSGVNGINHYPSLTRGVEALILVLLTFRFYVIHDQKNGIRPREAHFWMIAGILLYFGTQIFSNFMMEYFINAYREMAFTLKTFHAWINIFSNICYGIALLFQYTLIKKNLYKHE